MTRQSGWYAGSIGGPIFRTLGDRDDNLDFLPPQPAHRFGGDSRLELE
jgi:hypothetical protein